MEARRGTSGRILKSDAERLSTRPDPQHGHHGIQAPDQLHWSTLLNNSIQGAISFLAEQFSCVQVIHKERSCQKLFNSTVAALWTTTLAGRHVKQAASSAFRQKIKSPSSERFFWRCHTRNSAQTPWSRFETNLFHVTFVGILLVRTGDFENLLLKSAS